MAVDPNAAVPQPPILDATPPIPTTPTRAAAPAVPPPPAGNVRGYAPVQSMDIPAEGRALLATIGSPGFESNGGYTQRFNQPDFQDFSQHPATRGRINAGPNRGNVSDAAGRYQFLSTTWKDQAKKLDLQDFSPANQDKAAWNLARETYAKQYKGRNLATDLKNPNRMTQVTSALRSQWTSLPGGIENRQNFKRFSQSYNSALAAEAQRGPSNPVAAAPYSPWDPQGAGYQAAQRIAPATAQAAARPRSPLYNNPTSP